MAPSPDPPRSPEQTTRLLQQRQEFLLRLSDELRPLEEPAGIRSIACRLLGHHLHADRVFYVEFDPEQNAGIVADDFLVPGLPSLAGVYPFEAFRSTYERQQTGETWAVHDVHTDTTLTPAERDFYIEQNVIAWLDIPLAKAHRLEAILCVVQTIPRQWTPDEISLVEDVAERLWSAIGRGRAEADLHLSEHRLQALARISFDATFRMSPDRSTMYQLSGGAFLAPAVSPTDTWLDRYIPPADRPLFNAAVQHAIDTRSSFDLEHRIIRVDGSIGWTRSRAVPLLDHEGHIVEWIGAVADISLRKQQDADLLHTLGETEEELLALSRHLLSAQEEERVRLARDLHDGPGQRAALIGLEAGQLERIAGHLPGDATPILARLRQHIADLSREIREVSRNLHPAIIADLGLPAALTALIEEHINAGARVTLHLGKCPPLPIRTAISLFRIAQEALANAARHAPGAAVAVSLSCPANAVLLSVRDNGPGFDLAATRTKGGLGLISVHQRAHLIHGNVEIRTAIGCGTEVLASVSLDVL